MIGITILGTSCMVPTKERNHSSFYAEIKGTGILFDCGEGTQRQMNIAGIPRSKVEYIFISHWHADHTAGLSSLIQTISAEKENPALKIFGPIGTKTYFDHLLKASAFGNGIDIQVQEFDVSKVTTIFSHNDFSVQAVNVEHGIPCIAFSLIESDKRKMKVKKLEEIGVAQGPLFSDLQKGKDITVNGKKISAKEFTTLVKGKKFTYIPDTRLTQNAISIAKQSDLVLSEASYGSELEEKAETYFHMTAAQAAQIASASNSKKLLLTHFSQRYKDVTPLVKEAQDIFPETQAAFDFMNITLK